MNKKYELTKEYIELEGRKLYRIKSLTNFNDVKIGDLGGYIETKHNLTHSGNAWVYDDAKVYDNAHIYGNARIECNAQVYGNAIVYNNAKVYEHARVSGNAEISGNAQIFNNAIVFGNAQVYGKAKVFNNTKIYGNAQVSGNAHICSNSLVYGNAIIDGNVIISSDACICGNALIHGDKDYTTIKGFGEFFRNTTFFKTKDGVEVSCGCFHGTIDKFRKQVEDTREGEITKEYLMIADLMEQHFTEE